MERICNFKKATIRKIIKLDHEIIAGIVGKYIGIIDVKENK